MKPPFGTKLILLLVVLAAYKEGAIDNGLDWFDLVLGVLALWAIRSAVTWAYNAGRGDAHLEHAAAMQAFIDQFSADAEEHPPHVQQFVDNAPNN